MTTHNISVILTRATALAVILFLFACSDKTERDSSNVAYETKTAIKAARSQAMKLSDDRKLSTIEIEKIIIDVRVREQQLRKEEENQLADTYISTFLTTLDSVNPALHNELSATH